MVALSEPGGTAVEDEEADLVIFLEDFQCSRSRRYQAQVFDGLEKLFYRGRVELHGESPSCLKIAAGQFVLLDLHMTGEAPEVVPAEEERRYYGAAELARVDEELLAFGSRHAEFVALVLLGKHWRALDARAQALSSYHLELLCKELIERSDLDTLRDLFWKFLKRLAYSEDRLWARNPNRFRCDLQISKNARGPLAAYAAETLRDYQRHIRQQNTSAPVRIPQPLVLLPSGSDQQMPEMVETVRSSSSGAKSGHPLEFLVTRPAGSAKAVPLGGPMGPPAGPAGAGPGPPQRVPVVGSIPATTQASPMRCVHCKHAEHELEMLRKEHQSLQQQLAEMRQMGDAQEKRAEPSWAGDMMFGTSVQRCVRCKTAEQELEMLRREQHSLEQQLLLSKQQLQHAEEEGRQQLKSLTEMDRKLAQATAKLREAEKLKASLEPEVQAQANTEAALCAWRTEAESHRASLEAAEQRCAEQLRRAQAARRHAAEVERQRKEVVRNSGLQLNTALAEKAEMDKRLKKALREMEAATVELQAYKDEALEASKAKEQLQKQRRFAKSEAGQAESLQRQFSEAEQQRRALQVELAKSQRLRQAACAERDQVQQELQQWRTVGLADRLRQVEGRPWSPVSAGRASPQAPQPVLGGEVSMWEADVQSPKEAPSGERLLEMIQIAKERAVQRRHLSDATEEVRQQAPRYGR
eukprot:g108.t1